MFYNQVAENGNTRETVNQWMGYNHNYNLTDGQFYDSLNMSSDCFPYLTQRRKRSQIPGTPQTSRAIIRTAEGFAYLADTTFTFYMDGEEKQVELEDYFRSGTKVDRASEQTIVKMGAYYVIMPVGVMIYLDFVEGQGNIPVVEKLGAKLKIGIRDHDENGELIRPYGKVMYYVVDANGDTLQQGDDYRIQEEAPEYRPDGSRLKEGDKWYDTKNKQMMVYDRDTDTWMPATTTFVKIANCRGADGDFEYEDCGMDQLFKVGDCVYMNTDIPEINNGSIIQAIDGNSITVIGMTPTGKTYSVNKSSVTIERRIPTIDHMCVSNNRIWGCRYGLNNQGKYVNEIMCCKQGDPKNWYVYDGLSTDSYAISIGDDGAYTGCIEYQGMPTFFRENMIYKIYGTYPANYQLITQNARGVQKGSADSLTICNEYLLYKSPVDVVIYDGNKPTGISLPLGREELFYNAAGGYCMGKYYIAMEKQFWNWEEDYGGIERYLFVYDMDYQIWHREDALNVDKFLYSGDGKLYGYKDGQGVFGFGAQNSTEEIMEEEDVAFWAETGEQGFEYPDHKYLDRITLRAFIGANSYLIVEISYDGKPWETIGTLYPNADTTTETFSFAPLRCDHFRLRFEGRGNVRIYTLSRTMDAESEERRL